MDRKKGAISGLIILFAVLIACIYYYLKYGTIFLALNKSDGGYQIALWKSNTGETASILVIVVIIIGMIDLLVSRSLKRRGMQVLLCFAQITILHPILKSVLSKPIDLTLISQYSLSDYIHLGIFIIILLAIVQTIITFVLRLIGYCLLLHGKRLNEV